MNSAILLELAKRWQTEAENTGIAEEDTDYTRGFDHGRRETLRETADALKMLVQLLG